MKLFTDSDVEQHGAIPNAGKMYANREELIQSPMEWQKAGLQQTSSGYGSKLNTGLKINFNGREYRLYSTCHSNVASVWFKVKGRTIYVS